MKNHIRRWNIWRKGSLNNRWYKLLVLSGFINSPTMRLIQLPEEKNPFDGLDLNEVRDYPLPEMATSEKPNTKLYYTFCRANGKTMRQYEYIKAMLDAGYVFVPVEERGLCTTYYVKAPGKEKE